MSLLPFFKDRSKNKIRIAEIYRVFTISTPLNLYNFLFCWFSSQFALVTVVNLLFIWFFFLSSNLNPRLRKGILKMKFCKKYEEYMEGQLGQNNKKLPRVGLKKLKKILKRCRRCHQSRSVAADTTTVHDTFTCPHQCTGLFIQR